MQRIGLLYNITIIEHGNIYHPYNHCYHTTMLILYYTIILLYHYITLIVKDEGYEVTHNNKCITVFSAPNYCDQMGNKGAYIIFDLNKKDSTTNSMIPQFTQFTHVPHPNVPPMSYASNAFGL